MNPSIKLLNEVLSYLKSKFVGKDDIIDLLGIALASRENAFLLGPPGTAKSAIVKELANCVENGKNFEYLLSRFTEPNEIFGPFDIRKLKEGELVTNVEGMMPEAALVFLDEIFNANSAILNSLLMALNEKVFRRGKETFHLPALMFVGASNQLPEDESLGALLDRFLLRVRCDYVAPDLLEEVLVAGKKLEVKEGKEAVFISPETIRAIQADCVKVDLSPIIKEYVDLVHAMRNVGIKVSDRRAVKCQKLIAASALLSGRTVATISDFWVLKYIWDTEEQIEILAGLINAVTENDDKEKAHPRAFSNQLPNAEQLMKELQELQKLWDNAATDFETKNLVKDKLRHLQSQCKWITQSEHKEALEKELEDLWQKMLQVA